MKINGYKVSKETQTYFKGIMKLTENPEKTMLLALQEVLDGKRQLKIEHAMVTFGEKTITITGNRHE